MPVTRHPAPPPPGADDAVILSEDRRAPIPAWIEAIFASISVGILVGAVNGFLIGGVGGRVAMRILVLTSSDAVRGITSDDGFEIGRFSAETIILLFLTTILGGIAGAGFGFLRLFVAGRTWLVALGFAVTCSSVGGAMLVQTHGIDFRFLGPLWLGVGLFVAIPGIWGAAMVLASQRLTANPTLLKRLPIRINETRWGGFGWAVLVALTVIGLLDLVDDIASLRS